LRKERRWELNKRAPVTAVCNPPNSFDVAVLGGGPVGLAAALTLHRYSDLSVLVIEKSSYDLPRAGEILSPGIRGLLEDLGVWGPFLADGHLPSFGTGWHLDRRRFDQTLADHAEAAGAAVWRAAQAHFEPINDGRWRLDLVHAGKRRQLEAGFLVDATGKAALVARHCGVKRRFVDRMVAVAATVELPARMPSENADPGETCEQGWWYSARLPSALMTIALMSDTDLIQRHGLAASETR